MIPVVTSELEIGQLAEAVKSDAAIVDVRGSGAYVADQVPGAVLIPMGHLSGHTAELDRQAPEYVVCASGSRGAAVTGFPRVAGFDASPGGQGANGRARAGRPVVGGYGPRA